MIKVYLKNVYSRLSSYTEELEKRLTVAHPNYWFSPKYKSGFWDGRTHFLSVASLKFPTGLLFIVKEYFKETNTDYEIIDNRTKPNHDFWKENLDMEILLNGIKLRDYQIDAIIRGYRKRRGIFEIATGLGKTEIAAGLMKILNVRTLFMVHTQDLLYQTVKRLSERLLGTKIGLIGDGMFEIEPKIVVATVQSLNRLMFEKNEKGKDVLNKKTGQMMKEFLNSFKMMFQDETHHSSSMSFYRIAMFMHSAYFRFGLSGTPLRRDNLSNMKVMAVTGNVIYDKLAEEGIEEGYLSNIEVRIIENTEKVFGISTKWMHIYNDRIVRSEYRNTLITEIVEAMWRERKKIMILIRILDHGKILQRMLVNRYHIPTAFLSGRDPAWRREQIKEKFNIQDMDPNRFVLIASPIFDEGVDIPEIEVLIHAPGGKSEVKLIQKTGRGLRIKESGSGLIVYDFDDTNTKFLKKHSKQRIKIYKKEGFLK